MATSADDSKSCEPSTREKTESAEERFARKRQAIEKRRERRERKKKKGGRPRREDDGDLISQITGVLCEPSSDYSLNPSVLADMVVLQILAHCGAADLRVLLHRLTKSGDTSVVRTGIPIEYCSVHSPRPHCCLRDCHALQPIVLADSDQQSARLSHTTLDTLALSSDFQWTRVHSLKLPTRLENDTVNHRSMLIDTGSQVFCLCLSLGYQSSFALARVLPMDTSEDGTPSPPDPRWLESNSDAHVMIDVWAADDGTYVHTLGLIDQGGSGFPSAALWTLDFDADSKEYTGMRRVDFSVGDFKDAIGPHLAWQWTRSGIGSVLLNEDWLICLVQSSNFCRLTSHSAVTRDRLSGWLGAIQARLRSRSSAACKNLLFPFVMLLRRVTATEDGSSSSSGSVSKSDDTDKESKEIATDFTLAVQWNQEWLSFLLEREELLTVRRWLAFYSDPATERLVAVSTRWLINIPLDSASGLPICDRSLWKVGDSPPILRKLPGSIRQASYSVRNQTVDLFIGASSVSAEFPLSFLRLSQRHFVLS